MTKELSMHGTWNRLWLVAGLVVVVGWPGVAVAASTITGTVTFAGKPPNTMGNVIVYLSKGLPAGKTWPAPKTPVTLDQKGCQYVPHAMGIMVGQPYRILNSDGILHNVHTLPKINRSFNRAMPATSKEATTTFDKPEPIFQIKCDVHPWMSAYIGVFTHPFYSVTSTDGKFNISGLDAGTYVITAWHERLGTQTASVTVSGADTKTQDFKFAVPAK
jgi:plastocyanin